MEKLEKIFEKEIENMDKIEVEKYIDYIINTKNQIKK